MSDRSQKKLGITITKFLHQKWHQLPPPNFAGDGHPGSFLLFLRSRCPCMRISTKVGSTTHIGLQHHNWLQPKKKHETQILRSPNTWICLFLLTKRGMEVRVRCFIFRKTPRLCLSLEDNVRKSEPRSSKNQISLDVAPRSEDIFSLQAGLVLEN